MPRAVHTDQAAMKDMGICDEHGLRATLQGSPDGDNGNLRRDHDKRVATDQGWTSQGAGHRNRVESSFFKNESLFPSGSVEFDCALLMRGIDHAWHAREPICSECSVR